ncbi:hypothetical protein KEM60_00212 [Austwickia sp. TVS 96-490-7B]|uniref:barstar family protein n=1 Tax=Austwickia sp. TVS 96-490-7B TaxID=2830843 RepID=UPI001C56F91C|nr:barstar family protein [Austwickia sp. TVS 96-490-7B]MBW3084029.1 hypothetical protein [Austwickia sp. TVS 96-490-7B]
MTASVPGIADVVPDLVGQHVLTAAAHRYDAIAAAARRHGYLLRDLDGAALTSRSRVLPALAGALRLPGAADHNVDAIVDALRDLPQWWPEHQRLLLCWHGPDSFAAAAPHLWTVICQVLADASGDLATAGFAFETVLFPVSPDFDDRALPPGASSSRSRTENRG